MKRPILKYKYCITINLAKLIISQQFKLSPTCYNRPLAVGMTVTTISCVKTKMMGLYGDEIISTIFLAVWYNTGVSQTGRLTEKCLIISWPSHLISLSKCTLSDRCLTMCQTFSSLLSNHLRIIYNVLFTSDVRACWKSLLVKWTPIQCTHLLDTWIVLFISCHNKG